jgi:hypothetical protein
MCKNITLRLLQFFENLKNSKFTYPTPVSSTAGRLLLLLLNGLGLFKETWCKRNISPALPIFRHVSISVLFLFDNQEELLRLAARLIACSRLSCLGMEAKSSSNSHITFIPLYVLQKNLASKCIYPRKMCAERKIGRKNCFEKNCENVSADF